MFYEALHNYVPVSIDMTFLTDYILDNRQQTTTRRGCHEAEKTIHTRV